MVMSCSYVDFELLTIHRTPKTTLLPFTSNNRTIVYIRVYACGGVRECVNEKRRSVVFASRFEKINNFANHALGIKFSALPSDRGMRQGDDVPHLTKLSNKRYSQLKSIHIFLTDFWNGGLRTFRE